MTALSSLSPETKKRISTLVVTVCVAVLGTLGTYVARLPPEMQIGASAIVAGCVHFVNAWGSAQRVEEKVQARVAAIIESEP